MSRPRLIDLGRSDCRYCAPDELCSLHIRVLSVCPPEFTICLSRNDDGWWAAQVVEYPAAISQGTDAAAAALAVLDALFEVLADERIA